MTHDGWMWGMGREAAPAFSALPPSLAAGNAQDFFNSNLENPSMKSMRHLMYTLAVAVALAPVGAVAVDEHHPDQKPAATTNAPAQPQPKDTE